MLEYVVYSLLVGYVFVALCLAVCTSYFVRRVYVGCLREYCARIHRINANDARMTMAKDVHDDVAASDRRLRR